MPNGGHDLPFGNTRCDEPPQDNPFVPLDVPTLDNTLQRVITRIKHGHLRTAVPPVCRCIPQKSMESIVLLPIAAKSATVVPLELVSRRGKFGEFVRCGARGRLCRK